MYEKTALKISHIEESTELLGPYSRFVIWVHGCCFDCEGCLAHNTRYGPYETMSAESLGVRIAGSSCEGVTLSGGEPFLQAAALAEMIVIARQHRDVGVIVYSGFTLEEIRQHTEFLPLLSQIDLLIDGRYQKELDDGRAYVGSSNQTVHYLTERYAEAGRAYYAQTKRRAEIKLTPNQAVLIGVPSKNVLKLWQDMKAKSGGGYGEF